MATVVRELMNPEVFVVKPGDPADETLATLLALRLSAAPVVDPERRAVGMISLRDLASAHNGDCVAARMSKPAVTVRDDCGIDKAAHTLAEAGLHHTPVVDQDSRVVGFLSLLDVVRGLLGIPAPHPAGFAHFDEKTGVVWNDPRILGEEQAADTAVAPGVLLLLRGGRDLPETIVWAESTHDLRARALRFLSEPLPAPRLSEWHQRGELRFRTSVIPDEHKRTEVLAQIQPREHRLLWKPPAK